MRLDSSGNIGIGTTTPYAALDVNGNIRLGNHDTGVPRYVGWTINNGFGPANFVGMEIEPITTNGNNFSENVYLGTHYYGVSGGQRMMVRYDGNVGIGTTNPTQKLSVNGTIRAKEVIVDTGWSDYVFDKDYRLAPLAEVEQHIKTEKHLPGIPSAAEVAEHGVSMGDMQSKLLAKIEEVTLHQIEQEKRLNAQAARIAQLENENNSLLHR